MFHHSTGQLQVRIPIVTFVPCCDEKYANSTTNAPQLGQRWIMLLAFGNDIASRYRSLFSNLVSWFGIHDCATGCDVIWFPFTNWVLVSERLLRVVLSLSFHIPWSIDLFFFIRNELLCSFYPSSLCSLMTREIRFNSCIDTKSFAWLSIHKPARFWATLGGIQPKFRPNYHRDFPFQ